MTSPRSFQRSQIAIPGSGLKEIGTTLKEVVEEYGKDYQAASESQLIHGCLIKFFTSEEWFDFCKRLHRTYSKYLDQLKGNQKLESQMLRVENKLFYFDIGENRMGTYLRISEVRSNFRAAIAIPSHSWGRFRDVISQYVDASSQDDGKK